MKKTDLTIKVGAEIRRLRQAQGHSQEGFADDCGIHRTYMGSIERGETAVSIEMAKRVVAKLGITLGQFFTLIEE